VVIAAGFDLAVQVQGSGIPSVASGWSGLEQPSNQEQSAKRQAAMSSDVSG